MNAHAEVDSRRREAAAMCLRVTPIMCLLAFVLSYRLNP